MSATSSGTRPPSPPATAAGPSTAGTRSSVSTSRASSGYSIYYSIPINLAKPLLDPKYAAGVGLSQAFPTDLQAIVKRAKQIFTQSGQVPAATKQDAGAQGFTLDVYPLEDILFVVESPGKDLALAAISPADNTPVGLSNLAAVGSDMLIVNNQSLSKLAIYVMNYDKKPANFALTAYVIQW